MISLKCFYSKYKAKLMFYALSHFMCIFNKIIWEHGGVVVECSDSESRGPGLDPHRRHCVVSLSKTH